MKQDHDRKVTLAVFRTTLLENRGCIALADPQLHHSFEGDESQEGSIENQAVANCAFHRRLIFRVLLFYHSFNKNTRTGFGERGGGL